jgi:glucosamine-6-phosphate deaminase
MPFYRTGRVKKDPIGEEDVRIILDLLRDFEPDHVFVAGDLSDPHGTHRMCYSAIKEALRRYRRGETPENGQATDVEATGGPATGGPATDGQSADGPFTVENPPTVWLYRGAWQEWEIDEADVFLPLSKADLDEKIDSIFKHESQKDRALFPGAYDEREFWQRARDRNTETASELDAMGLPEFYAAEAYVVVEEMP